MRRRRISVVNKIGGGHPRVFRATQRRNCGRAEVHSDVNFSTVWRLLSTLPMQTHGDAVLLLNSL